MALRKPGSSARPGGMTAREYFEKTPESLLPTNLIDGELIVMPSPRKLHQVIVRALLQGLEAFEDAHGGEVILSPMDVELDERVVLQPDLGYIARGGLATFAEHVVGPPDLVVEVLSPSHRDLHRRKMTLFARYGVREAWVVDPEARSLHLYTNQDGTWDGGVAVPFGEPIPSRIVDIGDGGLGALGS